MSEEERCYYAQNAWWAANDPMVKGAHPDRWVPIRDAQPITVPGWEHLELCVHKVVYGTHAGYWWNVTEASTGCWIFQAPTKCKVLAAIKDALNRQGREVVDAVIAQTLRTWGHSPRHHLTEWPAGMLTWGRLREWWRRVGSRCHVGRQE